MARAARTPHTDRPELIVETHPTDSVGQISTITSTHHRPQRSIAQLHDKTDTAMRALLDQRDRRRPSQYAGRFGRRDGRPRGLGGGAEREKGVRRRRGLPAPWGGLPLNGGRLPATLAGGGPSPC